MPFELIGGAAPPGGLQTGDTIPVIRPGTGGGANAVYDHDATTLLLTSNLVAPSSLAAAITINQSDIVVLSQDSGATFGIRGTIAQLAAALGTSGGTSGSITASTSSVATSSTLSFTYSTNAPTPFVALAVAGTTAGTANPSLLTGALQISANGTSGAITSPGTAESGVLVLMSSGLGPVIAVSGTVTVTAAPSTWGNAVVTGGAYAASSGSTWNQQSLDAGYATITPPSLPNAAMHIDCYFYVNTLSTNQIIFAYNGITVFMNASGPVFGYIYYYNHNDNTTGFAALSPATVGAAHLFRLVLRPGSGIQLFGDGVTPGAVATTVPAPTGNILVGTEDGITNIQSGNVIYDLQVFLGDPGSGNYTPTNTAPTGSESGSVALYKFNANGNVIT